MALKREIVQRVAVLLVKFLVDAIRPRRIAKADRKARITQITFCLPPYVILIYDIVSLQNV